MHDDVTTVTTCGSRGVSVLPGSSNNDAQAQKKKGKTKTKTKIWQTA